MLEFKKDGWKAIVSIAPTLLLMALFTFFPIVNSFIMAFKQDYNFLSGVYNGFGISNFVYVLNDPMFKKALGNTAIMVIISVPATIIVSLLVSISLNSIKRLQGFFQTIFFLPYVTNTIALGLVFGVVFHKDYGLINNILGLGKIDWLGTGATYWKAMAVLMIYTLWDGLAFKIIVFLSGLQSIDKQYYQSAQIDGASKSRTLFKITVPLLSPMILYITITSFIGAFKAYSSVIALFSRGTTSNDAFGPDNMLITVVGYVYDKMWGHGGTPFGVASAAILILFAIILVITILQLQVSKKRVHY